MRIGSKNDSLKKRYLFKLITSFLVIPLNFLTISLITRMLGPGLYGDYKYLLYVFTVLAGVVGFGGNYFRTELSRNHFDKPLISFYWYFITLSWMLAFIIILSSLYTGVTDFIFPRINIAYIPLAFLLVFLISVSSLLESMTDSCGLTTNASIFNFCAKIAGLIVLVGFLFFLEWINLTSVFCYGYIAAFVLIIAFVSVLKSNGIPVFHFKISWGDFKGKFANFYEYSHPLLVLTLIGTPMRFAGRWMLQTFGGSVQQGYFSLSDSFSAFIITFSNSITPLLLREFSISFSKKDIAKMSALFSKSIALFTAVSSYFSVFLALNASTATIMVGSASFKGAIVPTTIMLFYPIPYIGNNIIYVMIYATNRTVLLRNVQILTGLFGLIIAFLLMAPKNYFGFDLGATGFAISMVSSTYLTHFILLKYCTSELKLKWVKITANYIKIIISFLFVGMVAKLLCGYFLQNIWIAFFCSGILYTLGVAALVKYFPGFIGVSKAELRAMAEPILNKLRNT